jgi:hypothetical protein
MSLSARITKLAFITQNNHVYEYTAEDPTPKVSLNIRSPYRRQKRDFSIIRLSFRRPYWNRNTCDYIDYLTFLPITPTTSYLFIFLPYHRFLPTFLRSHQLFPTFLLSCDHTDYFLISYLPTFLRSHRLFPIFLSSCDHIDYFLPSYLLAITSITRYRHTYR